MIKVNDTVIYSGKGVCTVSSVEQRDFGGTQKSYYILKPVYNDSATIYVPVDNPKLVAKMKRVLERSEVDEIILNISLNTVEWIEDAEKRRLYYKQILEEANRSKILGAIICIKEKQLQKSKKDKKPHIFDIAFMQENEKIILEEFAISLNISPKEVTQYIDLKLNRESDENI